MPEIVISPRGKGPFPVGLAVFEEDTWMLLSAGSRVREPRGSTQELIEAMSDFEPAKPGSFVVKGNLGYGIVHDLDESPSCRPSWVGEVLTQLVEYCRSTGIRSVAIEPLGCLHGSSDIDAFITRLSQVPGIDHLARIWVMC